MFRSRRGFTLMELIVVMAVIAILVVLAVPSFTDYSRQSNVTQLIYDARLVEDALIRYYMEHGDYSVGETGSDALLWHVDPQSLTGVDGMLTSGGMYIALEHYNYPRDYLEPEREAYQVNLDALRDYVRLRRPRDFYVSLPVGFLDVGGVDPEPEVGSPVEEPDSPAPFDPDAPPCDPGDPVGGDGPIFAYHDGTLYYRNNIRLGYMSNNAQTYHWAGVTYDWGASPRQFVADPKKWVPTGPVDVLEEYGYEGWRFYGIEWAGDLVDGFVYGDEVPQSDSDVHGLYWTTSINSVTGSSQEGWHYRCMRGTFNRYRRPVRIWYVRDSGYRPVPGGGSGGHGEEDEDNLAIKQVVGGGGNGFSLALKSDGTVWAWGNNYCGQLGNGTTVKSVVPVKVKNLSNIIAIAAGYDHCLALSRNGTVWAWGGNSRGQLGNGLFEDDYYYGSTVPVQVLGPGGDGYLSGVKAIAAGYQYSMALMDDGTVWAWGDNMCGSLGIGKDYWDYGLSSPYDGPAVEALPVRVVGPGGEGYLTGVAAIAPSVHGSSSYARLNDGSVWAWGFNRNGELGIGKYWMDYEDEPYEVCPVRVLGPGGAGYLSGVKSIAPGFSHVLALLNDGSVLAWGDNWAGQLGNGDRSEVWDSLVPIYVKGPGGEGNLTDVAAIVSGDSFALALKNDGTVWAWGEGFDGQLGNGDYDCEYFPAQVKGADGVGFLTGVKLISAGSYHSLAVKNDGTLWAWGYNGYGQLGTGSYDDELFPFRLSNF